MHGCGYIFAYVPKKGRGSVRQDLSRAPKCSYFPGIISRHLGAEGAGLASERPFLERTDFNLASDLLGFIYGLTSWNGLRAVGMAFGRSPQEPR